MKWELPSYHLSQITPPLSLNPTTPFSVRALVLSLAFKIFRQKKLSLEHSLITSCMRL